MADGERKGATPCRLAVAQAKQRDAAPAGSVNLDGTEKDTEEVKRAGRPPW